MTLTNASAGLPSSATTLRPTLSTTSLQLVSRCWQPDLNARDIVGSMTTPRLRYRYVEIVTLRSLRVRQELDVKAGRSPIRRECLNSLRLMHIVDIRSCGRRLGPPCEGSILQLIAMHPDLNKMITRADLIPVDRNRQWSLL